MSKPLEIGVEISLYPLNADYIPPIQNFIDRLNAAGKFKVITNSMSTQVFGNYDDVFGALQREIRATFEQNDTAQTKAIFVMKVLGPLAPAS
jgi:uncharacterized protein YqgV (UPF0045/DUF77 family)